MSERDFTVQLSVEDLSSIIASLRTATRVQVIGKGGMQEAFKLEALVADLCAQTGTTLPADFEVITKTEGEA